MKDRQLKRAQEARRESRSIEFKKEFDPRSPRDWCELLKDIAAIANSGGGFIIFGADSRGFPVAAELDLIRA